LHTVNALLGHAPAISVGPLSRIERGLFHGVLAGLSARLGLLLTVGVPAEEREAPSSDAIVVEASLGLLGGAGRAWLCAPVEFLAQILTAQSPTSKKSSAMFCLELARTRVPVSHLAAAKAGDVVVFDEVRALPAADPWPIHIRNGGAVVSAWLRPDGIVAGGDADDPGIATQDERRSARIPTPSDSSKSSLASTDAVEIVAELGRFQGISLARLLAGVPLDGGRGNSILLWQADTPWAEGESIAFDDAFAVRITRKLAG
jgi:flagellar motor switch/type III secretory pathway protein FliN